MFKSQATGMKHNTKVRHAKNSKSKPICKYAMSKPAIKQSAAVQSLRNSIKLNKQHPPQVRTHLGQQNDTSSVIFSDKQAQDPFSTIKKEEADRPKLTQRQLKMDLQPEGVRSKYHITHQCIFFADKHECDSMHCPCFLTQDELCIFGQCSPNCVEAKNHYFQEAKGWEFSESLETDSYEFSNQLKELIKKSNNTNIAYLKKKFPKEEWLQNLIFCTCKKTSCQKNYCLCYQNNVDCGEFCSCCGCLNVKGFRSDEEDEKKRLWQQYMVDHLQEQEKKYVST